MGKTYMHRHQVPRKTGKRMLFGKISRFCCPAESLLSYGGLAHDIKIRDRGVNNPRDNAKSILVLSPAACTEPEGRRSMGGW